MFRIYVDEGYRRPVCVACSEFAGNAHGTSPAHRRRAEAWIEDVELRGVEVAALFTRAQPGAVVARA
eukprot:2379526-Lingulodinium_polyedra.AAC.1